MAYPKAKGTIFLKIIIGLLIIVLAYSIYKPGKIWEEESYEQDSCRFSMAMIVEAQDQFFRINDVYADSLEQLIQFTLENERYSVEVDSMINLNSSQDFANRVKVNSPTYEYHQMDLSLSSLLTCPATDDPYVITPLEDKEQREDAPKGFNVSCPTEPKAQTLYIVFTKNTSNHGWINQRNETSW